MTYQRTNWADYPNLSTAINAARLNNMEAGIAAAIQPGAGQIVDADVAANAAIQYIKLNLALAIVNGDISPAAAIAIPKLAGYPGDVTQVLHGDGSWQAVSSGTPPSTQLDYAQITTNITSITATTEATSVTIVSGNSITYDGSKVRIEFFTPLATLANQLNFVVYRDATVLGQVQSLPGNAPGLPIAVLALDTPAAGAHVYKVSVFVGGGSGIVKAGAGGPGVLVPAFLRVTKA